MKNFSAVKINITGSNCMVPTLGWTPKISLVLMSSLKRLDRTSVTSSWEILLLILRLAVILNRELLLAMKMFSTTSEIISIDVGVWLVGLFCLFVWCFKYKQSSLVWRNSTRAQKPYKSGKKKKKNPSP